MTVKELKEQLDKVNPDLEVVVGVPDLTEYANEVDESRMLTVGDREDPDGGLTNVRQVLVLVSSQRSSTYEFKEETV